MVTDIIPLIPPAFILIITGLLVPFLHKYLRMPLVLLAPLLALYQIWNVPVGQDTLIINIAGFALNPLFVHPYTPIFATVFAIAAFAGSLFSLNQGKPFESAAAMIYAGSAIGVTFAGEFITLFLFWELMAVGSTMVIFASDQEGAMRAGMRYAFVHLIGGLILMVGIIAHIFLDNTIQLVPFEADMSILVPGYALDMNAVVIWLILIGILFNAAVPPISSWLPDSYAKSSPFGGVFLSAFTTKASVFVLITLFAGAQVLIYFGMAMILYGIIYAMMENDVRRVLSYSIISQVGFMLVCVGIGTDLALSGAAIHAFAHIIYKGLLFMSAGSVMYMTGKSKFTDLGGLCRSMKLTAICGIIGALSISAVPFTSGFLAKSMILASAKEDDMRLVLLLLLMFSAGTILYVGLKFPWFLFFSKDSGLRPTDPPLNMKLAMLLLSALCIIPAIPGVAEVTLYKMLPAFEGYNSYTNQHVISQLQLLLFSGLAFFLLLPLLRSTATITLDFDWFYRALGKYVVFVIATLSGFSLRIVSIIGKRVIKRGVKVAYYINHPEGIIARNWSLGTTATWVMALLAVYLVVYYL